jgi:hypothetical protein
MGGIWPRPATVPAAKPVRDSSQARARHVTDLCILAGADESLIDGWITVGVLAPIGQESAQWPRPGRTVRRPRVASQVLDA